MNYIAQNETTPTKRTESQLFTLLTSRHLVFIFIEIKTLFSGFMQSVKIQNADIGFTNIETKRSALQFIYTTTELNTTRMFGYPTVDQTNWLTTKNL